MTGGQTSLSLAGQGQEGDGNDSGISPIRRLPVDRARTRVITASEAELADHAARLAAIEKSAGAPALWAQMEEQTTQH